MTNISTALRLVRTGCNFTLRELAEKINMPGYTVQKLSDYEKGRRAAGITVINHYAKHCKSFRILFDGE